MLLLLMKLFLVNRITDFHNFIDLKVLYYIILTMEIEKILYRVHERLLNDRITKRFI